MNGNMKYSRVVITCGVSAFGGANAPRKWVVERGLLVFAPERQNPEPPEGKNETEALKAIERGLANVAELDAIASDPKRVSAEYSALHALWRKQRIVEHGLQVVMIHTDTLGGKAAALILRRLIERRFRATVDLMECSINVNDQKELRYNLGDFMHKVATALRHHDSRATCFAPLGGYKVMTSLGYLAGAYFGFPTLYTHEDDQVVHEVPPIPSRMTPDGLRALARLLMRVKDGIELFDLTEDERKKLEENSWLFERADDLVCVNAFGIFLMQENPDLFGAKILVSEEVDRTFGNDGRKPFIIQQLQSLAAKLNSGSTEANLRHEKDWSLAPHDDWHLFKGASNGQQILRAIYRWSEEDNVLYVKQVWTNHDAYEREVQSAWRRQAGDFTEWSAS